MNAIRRKLALAPAVAFALLLGACGGSENRQCPNPADATCPSPSPTPTPVVRTLIGEGSFSGLGERFIAEIPFQLGTRATIEATVDWTFATDDVDVFIVRGRCTLDQFNTGTCPFAAFATNTSTKPERVTAPNQEEGSYNLYILNLGPAEESVSFQIVQVTGGSASSASTSGTDRVKGAGDFVGIVTRH
jgi:hypothetical protein